LSEYTPEQVANLATLLGGHLTVSSLLHLADSLAGPEVLKELRDDIGDAPSVAKKIIEAVEAKGKIRQAIDALQEGQGDYRIGIGLNRILQKMPLDAGPKLEAFDVQMEAFLSSEEFERLLGRVRRAVCAIGLAKPGPNKLLGTGVLVGDNLVLTNYHVVEGFLKITNGKPVEKERGDKIYFYFDYSGPPSPFVPPTAPFTMPPVQAKSTGWLKFVRPLLPGDGTDTPAKYSDELDCALIELARPVGRLPCRTSGGLPRGWLTMNESLDAGAKVALFQHPEEMHQVFDVGEVFKLLNEMDRVWYWLGSAGGSSGGAAVDSEGTLVALHNASVETTTVKSPAGSRKLNQGIRIARIKQAIEAECPGSLAAATADPVPFWSLTDDLEAPEPALGRITFRDYVKSMLEPRGLRVLHVLGKKGSGVRFSKRLLRRIVGTPVPIIEFTTAELAMQSPTQFLGALRNALPKAAVLPAGLEKVPQPRGEEDLPRWIGTDLTDWLLKVVSAEQARSRGQFPAWVVINAIDENGDPMTTWGNNLRECIAALLGSRDGDKVPFDIPHLRWLFLARPEQTVTLGTVERHVEDLDKDTDHLLAYAQCVQWAWTALDHPEILPPKFLRGSGIAAMQEKKGPPRQVLAESVKVLVGALVSERRGNG
jgi:hypothetical protein